MIGPNLFGFVFIYRQREVSNIMIKLGTGKARVYRYFLYSSGMLSLLAVIGASVTSYLLSDKVVELVKVMAMGYKLSDKRYSAGNLSIVKPFEFNPDLFYWLFLAMAGVILIISLVSCSIYITQTFKARKKKRKIIEKHRAGHIIKMNGAGVKYSIASILRGGARTIVVPIVCAITIIFLGQLSNTADNYTKKIDEIGRDSEIRGHFTDIYGKLTNNVVVDSFLVRDMYNSGYIDDILFSKALHIYYHGISAKNGEPTELEPLEIPKEYAGETFMDQLRMGTDIVYTNNLGSTPEFFYSTAVEATYLDGYDETLFMKEAADEHLCILPENMMIEQGIEYGDSIRVYIPDYPDRKQRHMDLNCTIFNSLS